jgi:hypothetical protein
MDLGVEVADLLACPLQDDPAVVTNVRREAFGPAVGAREEE